MYSCSTIFSGRTDVEALVAGVTAVSPLPVKLKNTYFMS